MASKRGERRRGARLALGALWALACLVVVSSARADGASLRRCLELADRNHPEIAASRAKLAMTRAKLQEAHFAPFSNFTMQGGVAIAPSLLGSSGFSPNTDASLTSSLGLAWQARINGVVPLYTFGKITNLWDAAEADVDVKKAELDVSRDAVRFDVRRAYLGLQLARDSLLLLEEAESKLADAVIKLEEQVDNDEADPIALIKLKMVVADLEVRRAEGEKFVRVARAGLRYFTGVPRLEIADEPLKKAAHHVGKVGKYLTAARIHRPEMRMAKAGIAAREAQLELSRAQMFPDVALGLGVGFSNAPLIADQINPFVVDPANFSNYVIGLVFQWKLDFIPAWSRVEHAEAQLQQTMALDRKALGGIAAEVEEAHAEVIEAQKKLTAYQKSADLASEWLFTVQQAIDIGTMDENELTEPAKAWALQRFNVLNATMGFNLALAKLAHKTGWDAIAPGLM